jgi:hypothetical protein
MWEIPIMETVKVDSAKRVRLPDAKPGQVLAYEMSGNAFTLTPVKPVKDEAQIVKMIKNPDGTYRFPDDARPSRQDILNHLRAERDSR